MIAACDAMGHSSYGSAAGAGACGAHALHRPENLRRDHSRQGPHPDKPLEEALLALPSPRVAGDHPRCWFWDEISSRRPVVAMAERTLRSVFKRSAVKGAHAHRFRHTLATEILARGGDEQDVADILGSSPTVVRKHYAKWSQTRQDRITAAMQAVHPEAFGVNVEPATAKRVN